MSTVGVVTALAAEARALGRAREHRGASASFGNLRFLNDGSMLAVGGIGSEAAAAAAAALLGAGVSALMSFGTAGGLDPRLRAGTLLLPREVMVLDGARLARFAAAPDWRDELSARLGEERDVEAGGLFTSALPVDTVSNKAAMFRDTGAVAVDMESAAVAHVAADHDVPFVCVRVVVDTALDALPRAVTAASRAGRLHMGRLLWGLAAAPGEMAGLLKLARRYRTALHTLRAVARSGALTPPA